MSAQPVRLGFVGIGGRGSYHLDAALGIEGVEVPALCEIKDDRLLRARSWVEESGRPTPRLYGRSETDFERMCAEEDLDCVICATSWRWHTPVCLAANATDKHAVSEVPIVQTVEEAWQLVESYEKTGRWSALALENRLVDNDGSMFMHALHMMRKGVLGDLIHAECGYVHDLRAVKFPGGTEPWRLQHSIDRNGNLYPDHPLNRAMVAMDVNHGDRFDHVVSMSSRSGVLNAYAAATLGRDHPLAKQKMALGDSNETLIRTVGGRMITLHFDTNTPHPRGFLRYQGTGGVFFSSPGMGPPRIYLDGVSPSGDEWESAEPWLQRYQHPLVAAYDPPPRPSLRGHGSGTTRTPLTWHLLVEALRAGREPFFDVYDSVTSSAISPLSERSVAGRSRPVEVPDFTRGRWKTRAPVDFGLRGE
jgi:hypothetical protein